MLCSRISCSPMFPYSGCSPEGLKFRSKLQLAKYLGSDIDMTAFDFKTGKINAALLRKPRRHRTEFGRSNRTDSSLIPPIRQTASIFKQPVTLIKRNADSKSRSDLKHGQVQEKPSQVFWERRIEGLKATTLPDDEVVEFRLPKAIRPIGPEITEETAIRSLAASLHLRPQQVITGQQASRTVIEKNPCAFINPHQPLVSALCITDEDLIKQENRVRSARKSLHEMLDYWEHDQKDVMDKMIPVQ